MALLSVSLRVITFLRCLFINCSDSSANLIVIFRIEPEFYRFKSYNLVFPEKKSGDQIEYYKYFMNNSGQYNINTGNSYCLVILVMHTGNKSQEATIKLM